MDLDSMNPKQKLKEFKATQKDLRSKDPEVKLSAARKLHDPRYLVDGACLVPFLLSIVPKKVNLCYEALCCVDPAGRKPSHMPLTPCPSLPSCWQPSRALGRQRTSPWHYQMV